MYNIEQFLESVDKADKRIPSDVGGTFVVLYCAKINLYHLFVSRNVDTRIDNIEKVLPFNVVIKYKKEYAHNYRAYSAMYALQDYLRGLGAKEYKNSWYDLTKIMPST